MVASSHTCGVMAADGVTDPPACNMIPMPFGLQFRAACSQESTTSACQRRDGHGGVSFDHHAGAIPHHRRTDAARCGEGLPQKNAEEVSRGRPQQSGGDRDASANGTPGSRDASGTPSSSHSSSRQGLSAAASVPYQHGCVGRSQPGSLAASQMCMGFAWKLSRIPLSLRIPDLLRFFQTFGISKKEVTVRMPKSTTGNRGYCFAHFRDSAAAFEFRARAAGYLFPGSTNRLVISATQMQDLRHYAVPRRRHADHTVMDVPGRPETFKMVRL